MRNIYKVAHNGFMEDLIEYEDDFYGDEDDPIACAEYEAEHANDRSDEELAQEREEAQETAEADGGAE